MSGESFRHMHVHQNMLSTVKYESERCVCVWMWYSFIEHMDGNDQSHFHALALTHTHTRVMSFEWRVFRYKRNPPPDSVESALSFSSFRASRDFFESQNSFVCNVHYDSTEFPAVFIGVPDSLAVQKSKQAPLQLHVYYLCARKSHVIAMHSVILFHTHTRMYGHTHTHMRSLRGHIAPRTTHSSLNAALLCMCIRWLFALSSNDSAVCCSLPLSLWLNGLIAMFWHLFSYSHTRTTAHNHRAILTQCRWCIERMSTQKPNQMMCCARMKKEANSMCESFVVHRRVCCVPLLSTISFQSNFKFFVVVVVDFLLLFRAILRSVTDLSEKHI